MTVACQVSFNLFLKYHNGDRFEKLLAESHAKNFIRELAKTYPEVLDCNFDNLPDVDCTCLKIALAYLTE